MNKRPEDLELFKLWKKTATLGFKMANWEQYFVGKRRMGGKAMMEDAQFSLEEYRRWGFLSREISSTKKEFRGVNKKLAQFLSKLGCKF